MSAKTPFSKHSGIRDAVKNECQLQSKLPGFVQKAAEGSDVHVVLSDKKLSTKSGKVLLLEITGAQASGGGMFGAYKGTCAILGRCVKTLGSDIAKWLQHPSRDSRLGGS